MTTERALKLLETNHLVVAWDNTDGDETPFYYLGFLSKVAYKSDVKGSTKPVYTIQECYDGNNNHIGELEFDNIAPVDDKSCPKVFYNNGKSQSVGYLIGLRKTGLDGQDCNILVPPFDKKFLVTVTQGNVTFTENIKLGLQSEVKEGTENA
jgi:hypothetical protein